MSKLNTKVGITTFLSNQGYNITDRGAVLLLENDELNIGGLITDEQIEFVIDLCSINDLDKNKLQEIYEKILDENTEILPSSFGIDSDNPKDKRLVLVDSLAIENLDENELLLTLDALALNVIDAYDLLEEYLK
ncbi:TPA: DUF2170 family protein [Candidatus Poribacteria bacterium]|nr:DUF2170 family protein [Candidatus Poribacteria bacterium]HIA67294.1 DUF2170 family protein [Candidatus Poribacteria bacterium]HIB99300.1 DUF2170 family protein [Candidatus Poribacteria bacterium]HIC16975.1 DUF2170 family protein [Candidatus Poribacteria bacterium]HIO48636.1 DUF2170 family protein [Candidatus Poribacteria bacterium]